MTTDGEEREAETAEGASTAAVPLPDVVRARVVTLASEALGQLTPEQLPAPLKRVATFAPARRAKLAGNQIAGVLETDSEFRGRIAVHVRAAHEALAEAVESGTPVTAAEPGEVAALAYLLRPEGWESVVEAAAGAVHAERSGVAERLAEQQVERLRRQLDDAQREIREAREKTRTQLASLKTENAELRRKLGDARQTARTAHESAEKAEQRAGESSAAAGKATAAAEAEVRRLRQRVDELEREVVVLRRAERAEKGEGTLRARLLLDALLETAQGLRRELALPPVEGAPADAVAADVAEHGGRLSSSHGSLSIDDPALLSQFLALPRVHLIVDGYNVTKNAYPEASLEIQRERLLSGLAPLAARTQAEMTVVFDAADTEERPLVKTPRGVRVLYSPFGTIADDVIRDLVAAEPPGRPVVVVSTDQEVVRDVRRAGARVAASEALVKLLARA